MKLQLRRRRFEIENTQITTPQLAHVALGRSADDFVFSQTVSNFATNFVELLGLRQETLQGLSELLRQLLFNFSSTKHRGQPALSSSKPTWPCCRLSTAVNQSFFQVHFLSFPGAFRVVYMFREAKNPLPGLGTMFRAAWNSHTRTRSRNNHNKEQTLLLLSTDQAALIIY